VLLVGVLLYVLASYPPVKQELTCKGQWKDKEGAEIAHVQLTGYRWWVHLWSESDGELKVQTEKLAGAFYLPFVRKTGEGSLALYEFRNTEDGEMRGGYRVANGELTIEFADSFVFIGTCAREGNERFA
jgi:hypothetical protein